MNNQDIAEALLRAADLFETRSQVTPNRVRAFQQAAFFLQTMDRPVVDVLRESGIGGLERIGPIDPDVAGRIEELLASGHMMVLDELAQELGPEALFQTVPGIGPTLAKRIRDTFRIDTLEALGSLASSGELDQVLGIGPSKTEQILRGLERLRARLWEAERDRGEAAMDNREIAEVLFKVASLLNIREQANPFRVQAYRRAAASIQALDRPAEDILRHEGVGGLDRIPNVGPSIAARIEELLTTGRLAVIDQLAEELGPEALFQTVPGIGPTLAKRIRETLRINTLEELEAAARSGKLERVEGIGHGKAEQIVAGIERMRTRPLEAQRERARPSVEELLSVDEEYRRKAGAGELETIAPKRMNPTGEKWLPILNTTRGPRRYTAVFSNTRAAHETGKTHDWVVLYWSVGRQGEEEQATVVTETHGDLKGLRVVRGREDECREYYAHRGELQPV